MPTPDTSITVVIVTAWEDSHDEASCYTFQGALEDDEAIQRVLDEINADDREEYERAKKAGEWESDDEFTGLSMNEFRSENAISVFIQQPLAAPQSDDPTPAEVEAGHALPQSQRGRTTLSEILGGIPTREMSEGEKKWDAARGTGRGDLADLDEAIDEMEPEDDGSDEQ